MRKSKTQVLIILGPTATGKSALAIKLAKKFKGEVISADSRQVYKGLNVGTGKVTKKEMEGVPHHLLDVADPKKQFSASEYKTLAENSLRYIVAKSKLPIIAGGTGFYIDTITCAANFPNVPPNPEFRKKMLEKSPEELFKLIQKKDPARATSVDRNNKLRLVRALEIIEVLGKVPKFSGNSSPYEFVYIGVKPNDPEKRILLRIHQWLKAGLVAEVKRLHVNGLSWKRLNDLGLVYHTVAKYIRGEISKERMVEEMFVEIRQYSKRQMTWFKRNKSIKWFNPEDYAQIEKYARNMLG